jgi:hypothetical protein
VSHPQALNEEQILQLMTDAIPTIARRLEHNEGWAFLMKQANHVKEMEAENARLKAEVERLTKAGDAMASTLMNGGVIVSGYILADDWLKAKLLAAKERGQP